MTDPAYAVDDDDDDDVDDDDVDLETDHTETDPPSEEGGTLDDTAPSSIPPETGSPDSAEAPGTGEPSAVPQESPATAPEAESVSDAASSGGTSRDEPAPAPSSATDIQVDAVTLSLSDETETETASLRNDSAPEAGIGGQSTPLDGPAASVAAGSVAGVNVPRAFAATSLSPLLVPEPVSPSRPQLLFAVLGWVVREIQRTFFNRAPVVRPQETTLVLSPNETSSPTPFQSYDLDDDGLTYFVPARGEVGGPLHGWVEVDQVTGTFTYTRDDDYVGPDQFTVTVSDAGSGRHFHGLLGFLRPDRGHTDTATITLDIVAANKTPVVNSDSYTTAQGSYVFGNVLDNDSDPSGQTLTASVVSGPAHGELTMAPNGAFHYSPEPGWTGVDTFVYSASNAMVDARAVVGITVTPVNRAPATADDSYTTDEDTTVTGNVLGNDTDPDGDMITATVVLAANHGEVQLSSDGSFTYTPDTDFSGTDTFSYVASDGSTSSAPTLVTITVTPVNDVPVAEDDSFTISEDSRLHGNVLSNDTDSDRDLLTASLASGPAHGSLTLNADGTFSYLPTANYTGTDSFTYTVSDGTSAGNTATATITISPVNDAPVANNGSFSVSEDSTYTGNLDVIDVDGDTVSTDVVTGPAHGALTLNDDGSFTYTPDADYTGADSFTYTGTDGVRTTSPATVTITVTPIDDAPTARDDTYSMSEDGILTGSVLYNDSDVDGGSLTAALVFAPMHGALTFNADGSFTYTPHADYAGADSFAYTASDGTLTSNTAIVSITIAPTNDAPVAADDFYNIDEDTTLTGSLLTNDSDVEGDSLTVSMIDAPQNGVLDLNADGTFSYTPSANFNGADWFTYSTSDGITPSAPALVLIVINPVDDTVVATDDTFSMTEDSSLSGNILSNDVDIDGDSLSASLVDGPTHGELVLNNDGTFTYTPDADYHGTDSFTYSATDGVETSTAATVAITVTAVNDTPVATDDAVTTNEDASFSGDVLSNDVDVDGDSLTATLIDGPAHGELVLNNDGTFTYTPDADYYGTDSFTYTATDGTATSTAATVAITVTAVNDTPVATDDTVTTNEDTPLAGNVLTNDTDIDGDSLTATLVDGPTHGELVLNNDGTFTYTPDTDYYGTDSFTYTANDGTATSAVSTVSITVSAVNDAPVTADDTVTTNEDAPLSGDVLANDVDVEGDSLTASLVDGPAHGELVLNNDGTFTYTPDADYHGTDSFTYTANDGTATSAVSTVSITVSAVNDTPVTADDAVTTNEDTPLAGNVLTNDVDIDGDSLTAALVGGPTHGSLVLNDDGTFTYTPDTDYYGTDSFTYTATDGTATSAVSTVSITVTAVNDTPVATNDSVNTDEDAPLSGNVLTNDVDIDGDSLTASLVDGPTHGSLVLNNDGTFTYTPDADYHGTDSFTYTATDGTATSTAATVAITITAVNDTPVTAGDSFTTDEDTQLAGNVLTNDNDIDGDSLTATLVDGPTHGSLVLNNDGTFTYTPDANYHGTDSFTYTATDGTATSTAATVAITITAVNDTPVTAGDSFTTDEDTQLAGNVLTNDNDIDGDSLTATLVDGPTHGSLVLNNDGTFTYTPDANYAGTDSFTYTATDGTATSTAATVAITVTAVNDTPVTADDAYTIDEDYRLTASVLTNDVDVEGDSLTAALVDGPTHGELVLNDDGTFTYTPDADYHGTDSFTYTATDGTATSSPATVTITVNPVNDATVANNDSYSTGEDSSLLGNVLTNDVDVDGDTFTAALLSGPAHGTLVLNPDGSFSYTPTADYSGVDSFSYQVSDGTATSNTALVTIAVTAINDAPNAVDDSYTTDEDIPLSGNVLANDTDAEGDSLSATLVAGPTHGTLVLNSDGTFTYTPDADYTGNDSFTYAAGDAALTDTALVTVSITSVNDVPVATGDSFTTDEDTPLSGNVLTNDTDVDGDSLTPTLVDGPTHGELVLNNDGTFTYTPDADYTGADSFTYTATDGTATSAVSTVSITVTAVNDTPVATDDSVTTNEDTQLTGNVLTNDTDTEGNTLTATLVTGPSHGALTLNADGTFTYTPTTNYHGTDSFTYTATDGTTTSTAATVTVTVNAVNDIPVAVNNSYTTNENTQLTGNVLTNDTDADGNTLTATLVTGPTRGTLTLNSDGSFTYTPTTNYHGTDVFTYKANDGIANSTTAVVTITVTSVNDAPSAVNDAYTTSEESAVNGNVLANDTDADADTLTAVLASGPSHGALTLNNDGTFTYTPTANYNGTDSFTYTATDGAATSNTATVSITVNPVNDAPTAANDAFTANEDTQLAGNVLTNDTDVDGDTLTATLVNGPSHGALTLNSNGTFTYTPTANYNGTDSFTYTATDGTATSNTATVSITVNAVNDAPTAVNDSGSTNQGIALNGNVLTNDTDIDGNTLSATLVAGPAHGTVALNSNGSFTYTPTANYNGTDSFTYKATDGTATSNTATVSITVIDNVAPTAVDIQATNGGGLNISGYLEQGDSITYTFSEPINPNSILAGWNGTTTNVVVRGDNGGSSNDTLRIYNSNNTALLPLGTIDLGRTDFIYQIGGNGPITFGATGTASTMTMSGNTITIVLGDYDSPAFGDYRNITLVLTSGSLRWSPSSAISDLAGNTLSGGTANESGSSDRDF
ncbi:Ig-like domain-containing protein [Mycobacterium sp. G7A2]|uniref:Ig-like domain-containing protein n=2 Tax=unclassified Mycobacterium TaxID=2642494 RepID=UPI0035A8646B